MAELVVEKPKAPEPVKKKAVDIDANHAKETGERAGQISFSIAGTNAARVGGAPFLGRFTGQAGAMAGKVLGGNLALGLHKIEAHFSTFKVSIVANNSQGETEQRNYLFPKKNCAELYEALKNLNKAGEAVKVDLARDIMTPVVVFSSNRNSDAAPETVVPFRMEIGGKSTLSILAGATQRDADFLDALTSAVKKRLADLATRKG